MKTAFIVAATLLLLMAAVLHVLGISALVLTFALFGNAVFVCSFLIP